MPPPGLGKLIAALGKGLSRNRVLNTKGGRLFFSSDALFCRAAIAGEEREERERRELQADALGAPKLQKPPLVYLTAIFGVLPRYPADHAR